MISTTEMNFQTFY